MTKNLHAILCILDFLRLMYACTYSKSSTNFSHMNVLDILLHVTFVVLSIKNWVFAYMEMFGFVSSISSLVLASKNSLEANFQGDMAPTNDNRVTILVAQTLVCGSALIMIILA